MHNFIKLFGAVFQARDPQIIRNIKTFMLYRSRATHFQPSPAEQKLKFDVFFEMRSPWLDRIFCSLAIYAFLMI